MRFFEKNSMLGASGAAASCSVLDASANSGLFALGLSEKCADITLVDVSRKKLDTAEERMYQSEFYNGKYIQAALTDLSLIDDCSYDLSICCGNLFNALGDEKEKALRELKRVTKIGGSVIISALSRGGALKNAALNSANTESGENRRIITNIIKTGQKFPDKPDSLYYFTAEELKDMFIDCCFMSITEASLPCLCSGMRDEINRIDPFSDDFENLALAETAAMGRLQTNDSGDFIIIKGTKV